MENNLPPYQLGKFPSVCLQKKKIYSLKSFNHGNYKKCATVKLSPLLNSSFSPIFNSSSSSNLDEYKSQNNQMLIEVLKKKSMKRSVTENNDEILPNVSKKQKIDISEMTQDPNERGVQKKSKEVFNFESTLIHESVSISKNSKVYLQPISKVRKHLKRLGSNGILSSYSSSKNISRVWSKDINENLQASLNGLSEEIIDSFSDGSENSRNNNEENILTITEEKKYLQHTSRDPLKIFTQTSKNISQSPLQLLPAVLSSLEDIENDKKKESYRLKNMLKAFDINKDKNNSSDLQFPMSLSLFGQSKNLDTSNVSNEQTQQNLAVLENGIILENNSCKQIHNSEIHNEEIMLGSNSNATSSVDNCILTPSITASTMTVSSSFQNFNNISTFVNATLQHPVAADSNQEISSVEKSVDDSVIVTACLNSLVNNYTDIKSNVLHKKEDVTISQESENNKNLKNSVNNKSHKVTFMNGDSLYPLPDHSNSLNIKSILTPSSFGSTNVADNVLTSCSSKVSSPSSSNLEKSETIMPRTVNSFQSCFSFNPVPSNQSSPFIVSPTTEPNVSCPTYFENNILSKENLILKNKDVTNSVTAVSTPVTNHVQQFAANSKSINNTSNSSVQAINSFVNIDTCQNKNSNSNCSNQFKLDKNYGNFPSVTSPENKSLEFSANAGHALLLQQKSNDSNKPIENSLLFSKPILPVTSSIPLNNNFNSAEEKKQFSSLGSAPSFCTSSNIQSSNVPLFSSLNQNNFVQSSSGSSSFVFGDNITKQNTLQTPAYPQEVQQFAPLPDSKITHFPPTIFNSNEKSVNFLNSTVNTFSAKNYTQEVPPLFNFNNQNIKMQVSGGIENTAFNFNVSRPNSSQGFPPQQFSGGFNFNSNPSYIDSSPVISNVFDVKPKTGSSSRVKFRNRRPKK